MQAHESINRTSLTLFNPADGSILGELSDAVHRDEKSGDGVNYIFTGIAGDGTLNDLITFMDSGRDTVRYEYADASEVLQGEAFLLKPARTSGGGGTEVMVETPTKPKPIL